MEATVKEARLRQRVSPRLAPETAEEREARRRTRDRARRASESQARAVSRLQWFRANLARRIASESSVEREVNAKKRLAPLAQRLQSISTSNVTYNSVTIV